MADPFAVGDRVAHGGREAIIRAVELGNPVRYQLTYLGGAGPIARGGRAIAGELELLQPIRYKVGQRVSIAGIRGKIVEELPGNVYRVEADWGAQRGRGYHKINQWTIPGWRLTLG